MSKFAIRLLKNEINVKHGYPFKGEFFSDKGAYIVLTPGNFWEEGGFKQQPGKEKYYLGDIPSGYILKKGDLIVAMTEQTPGLLGSCAYVPDDNFYLHNQRLGLIEVDTKFLTKEYLYHVFKTKFVREQIRLTSSGTKVKHTSPERIYDVMVPHPSVSEQKKIAAVLSALDEKIELNNRINAKLEGVAKTIYDYWFVQFDFPDENGKPYKSSGGKMVYNQELKREIPAGWEVKKLGDVADLKAGGDRPREYSEIKTTDFHIPIFSNGIENEGLYGFAKDFVVNKPSISISARGTIGYTRIRLKPFVPIIRLVVVTPKNEITLYYIYEYIKSRNYDRSGSVQQQLTVPMVSEFYLLWSADIIEKFGEIIKSFVLNSEVLRGQNLQLAQLRDWLLPMLMSGQVRVK